MMKELPKFVGEIMSRDVVTLEEDATLENLDESMLVIFGHPGSSAYLVSGHRALYPTRRSSAPYNPAGDRLTLETTR